MKFLLMFLLLSTHALAMGPGSTTSGGECVYVHRNQTYRGPSLSPVIPKHDYQRAEQHRQYMYNGTVQFQTRAETMVTRYNALQTIDTTHLGAARTSLSNMYDAYVGLVNLRNELAANGADRFISLGGGGTLLEEFDYNLGFAFDKYNEASGLLNQAITRNNNLIDARNEALRQVEIRDEQWRVLERAHYRNTDRILEDAKTVPRVNPCQGCTNASCNQNYAAYEARRIATANPRCPCPSVECLDLWVSELESGMLRQMSHQPSLQTDPPITQSYPETLVLGAVGLVRAAVTEGAIASIEEIRDQGLINFNPITTPYGDAVQDLSRAALDLRSRVNEGVRLYKIGTRTQSNTGRESQFWSAENPQTTPNYAERYGIPPENMERVNFVEVGVIRHDTPFVTRPAPCVGQHCGGAYEVVVPEGGIMLQGHVSL